MAGEKEKKEITVRGDAIVHMNDINMTKGEGDRHGRPCSVNGLRAYIRREGGKGE